MEKIDKDQKPEPNEKGLGFLKIHETWPLFLMAGVIPFQAPGTWFTLNILVLSGIFWNDGIFHNQELALCYGLMFIIGACSKLTYGILADRYSRKVLLAITHGGSALGFFLCTFVPSGLGPLSFIFFLVFILFRELFTAETPVMISYIDDIITEDKRSQFFGLRDMLQYLVTVVATIICAAVFKMFWQQYFLGAGLAGMIVASLVITKGKEPKRGAQRNELHSILRMNSAIYKYKLNKETLRTTMFSPSNLYALIEGLFTQIVSSVPLFLAYPYLESAPHNLTPLTISLIVVFFGVPGLIVGSLGLAKISDNYGKKDIKNRVKIIFSSLVVFCGISLATFLVPIEELDVIEGNNIISVLSHGSYWILGFLYFAVQVFICLYFINQRPLLQKLNLPEAQGAVASANSFLEILSGGIGVIIAGFLLSAFNQSYQLTVLVLALIGLGGTTLWLFCLRHVERDVTTVSDILKERAKIMEGKN
nr:MFS transporter [Candidatus Sigynarchaeota archaeon]